jgi:uncharacterized SAM-binding protein YcdF (DUF218 family)
MSEYILSILRDGVIALSSPLNQSLLILAMGLCFRAYLPSKKALYRSCYIVATSWLYVCSQGFFSYWLIAPLENYAKPRAIETLSTAGSPSNSAIFVFACYYFDAPNMPEVSRWSDCSLRRLMHTALMYKQHPQPIVLTGGNFTEHSQAYYASAAKHFLMTLGVAESDIIDINSGTNSEQEVQALVNANLPYTHYHVVSSATHSYRVNSLLKRNNLPLFTLHPIDQNNVDPFEFSLSLPHISSLERSRSAIYEYFAIVKMWLSA